MSRTFLKYLLFVSIGFYIPLSSMAWGMLGHRIVGQIADTYITAKTRAEIRKILGNETIAIASTWADFIKSDTSFNYLSSWHYVDFASGLNYTQMKESLQQDSATDAYTRLNFLITELKKKNLPKDKKVMYLRLLIHIVGDVHQPLHVSPEGTSGGNSVKIFWFGQSSNLHRLWDEQLIEYQQLSYTEYTAAINFTTAAQRKTWQSQPISKWLFESYQISEDLHSDIKEANPRLSYLYNFQHVQTLNEQLLKGGVRLAGLLNQIFGS